MDKVIRLTFHEIGRPDGAAMDRLRREVGNREAERIVGLAFDELGEALAEIDTAFRRGDVTRLVARARALAPVCERVGLERIAAVARDVVATHGCADGAALGASAARLIRLMESSLTSVCSAPDAVL